MASLYLHLNLHGYYSFLDKYAYKALTIRPPLID